MTMFFINNNLKRSIAMKEKLNAMFPYVHSTVEIGEVKITRWHNQEIQIVWNNGKRDITTVLDLDNLERGFWGVNMAEGEIFNSTAVNRALEALRVIY